MTKEDIICKVKDEYDTLMKNRDLTRIDILNAFEHLIKVLTLKETPAPVKNCMRVFYRRNKNSDVDGCDALDVYFIVTAHSFSEALIQVERKLTYKERILKVNEITQLKKRR